MFVLQQGHTLDLKYTVPVYTFCVAKILAMPLILDKISEYRGPCTIQTLVDAIINLKDHIFSYMSVDIYKTIKKIKIIWMQVILNFVLSQGKTLVKFNFLWPVYIP